MILIRYLAILDKRWNISTAHKNPYCNSFRKIKISNFQNHHICDPCLRLNQVNLNLKNNELKFTRKKKEFY